MKKTINNEIIIGRLYEHSLLQKVVERADSPNKGTPFIAGTISVATDDDCLNIVEVHYTYITELTKNGKTNPMFAILKQIMDSGKTVLLDGKDNATILRLQASLGLNEFYSSRSGQEELVSVKRNEGGSFNSVTILTALPEPNKRNYFSIDTLITAVQHVEADEEKGISKDYAIVRGYVFDFRGAIYPVDFTVKKDSGINYFESLDVSKNNPVFTNVRGSIESQTIVRKIEEESAFGEPMVREISRTVREWVIDNAIKDPYPLGDAEMGITSEEMKTASANRELYLADVKKRQDEYQASQKAAATGGGGVVSAAAGGFDF